MCGIIGYVGPQDCTGLLLDALARLEYRGYDSTGIAVVDSGELAVRRSEGKLKNLRAVVAADPVTGNTGIGHTRWATHGGPTTANAHPHRSGPIAVVHNGIIENYLAFKTALIREGESFDSETDTEVIAHLIAKERRAGKTLEAAVRTATALLEGAFAIVVTDATTPNEVIVARQASPIVLGIGDGECFVASDMPAILGHTNRMVFLDEGALAVLRPEGVTVTDLVTGAPMPVVEKRISWTPAMAEKGGYKHFMLKEIHDQPTAIADTLRGRISRERLAIDLDDLGMTRERLEGLRRIYIVACGTSWHAGLVGRYLMEDLAGLSPHVELASEIRYRNAPMDENTLVIAISQSGETADTLSALRAAKAKGAHLLAVCNVIESSIPRLCHATIYTHAGPEIGVASTKAFTTQLVVLHLLALKFGRLLGRIDDALMASELDALSRVPALMEAQLSDTAAYEGVARFLGDAHSVLFLGRGALYPIALEGALKLKEISYIHAEGYAAGEMKHGPIALIEESVPSVILHPLGLHYDKVRSNLQEVKARSGPVLAVTTEGDSEAAAMADLAIPMPDVPVHILPLIASIPMQLLSYYVADHKGTDVDQPRNLAKAVTVE